MKYYLLLVLILAILGAGCSTGIIIPDVRPIECGGSEEASATMRRAFETWRQLYSSPERDRAFLEKLYQLQELVGGAAALEPACPGHLTRQGSLWLDIAAYESTAYQGTPRLDASRSSAEAERKGLLLLSQSIKLNPDWLPAMFVGADWKIRNAQFREARTILLDAQQSLDKLSGVEPMEPDLLEAVRGGLRNPKLIPEEMSDFSGVSPEIASLMAAMLQADQWRPETVRGNSIGGDPLRPGALSVGETMLRRLRGMLIFGWSTLEYVEGRHNNRDAAELATEYQKKIEVAREHDPDRFHYIAALAECKIEFGDHAGAANLLRPFLTGDYPLIVANPRWNLSGLEVETALYQSTGAKLHYDLARAYMERIPGAFPRPEPWVLAATLELERGKRDPKGDAKRAAGRALERARATLKNMPAQERSEFERHVAAIERELMKLSGT